MEGYNNRRTSANPNTVGPKTNVAVEWVDGGHGFVRSTPTIADDVVYLHSHPNRLVAFSTGTGEQRWITELGAQPDSDTEISYPSAFSTPTIVDDTVYVGGGNVAFETKESETAHVADHRYLYAIDRTSGEIHWASPTAERVQTAPVVAGDTVLFATQDGAIHAIDADDGSDRWAFAGEHQSAGPIPTLAVDGCDAYLNTSGDGLLALDVRVGRLQWRVPEIRSGVPPAVLGGMVYVGSMDGNLYAIDAEDGAVEWSYSSGGTTATSSPAVGDGLLIVGGSSGESGVPTQRIHAVDADTGEEIWTVETEEYVRSTPAIADGVAYVAAGESVFGIDLEGGEVMWHQQTHGSVLAPLSIADDRVFAATDTGHLFVFSEA